MSEQLRGRTRVESGGAVVGAFFPPRERELGGRGTARSAVEGNAQKYEKERQTGAVASAEDESAGGVTLAAAPSPI